MGAAKKMNVDAAIVEKKKTALEPFFSEQFVFIFLLTDFGKNFVKCCRQT